MKTALLIVLTLACGGLGAGWYVHWCQSSQTLKVAAQEKETLHAEVAALKKALASAEDKAGLLDDQLLARQQELLSLRKTLDLTESESDQLKDDLKLTREKMMGYMEQAETHLERVGALESQRGNLAGEIEKLNASLDGLDQQIAETREKLTREKGDKDYLLGELRRLQQERQALLAQFNSLEAIRAQYAKLKTEAVINRRMDWKRRGIYTQTSRKGAQRLMTRNEPAPVIPIVDGSLNVEFKEGEGARVVKPEDPETPPTNDETRP